MTLDDLRAEFLDWLNRYGGLPVGRNDAVRDMLDHLLERASEEAAAAAAAAPAPVGPYAVDISRLRELLQGRAVTPGPWRPCTCSFKGPCPHRWGLVVRSCAQGLELTAEDRELACLARNLAGELLCRWEEARRDREQYSGLLAVMERHYQARIAELEAQLAAARPPVGPCGQPHHASDCDCDGAGGPR